MEQGMTQLIEVRDRKPRYEAQQYQPGCAMHPDCGIGISAAGEAYLWVDARRTRVLAPGDWVVICGRSGTVS
jgi:hypothetical protein